MSISSDFLLVFTGSNTGSHERHNFIKSDPLFTNLLTFCQRHLSANRNCPEEGNRGYSYVNKLANNY